MQNKSKHTHSSSEPTHELADDTELFQRATCADRLRGAGLRPTRQRVVLGDLLFANGDRHVTAELLHGEAVAAGESVSLATVYNTLHQFKRAGLLREIAIEGARSYFDTNTSNHNHFLIEDEGRLVDILGDRIEVSGVPQPPDGMRISHIDVVVRLVPGALNDSKPTKR